MAQNNLFMDDDDMRLYIDVQPLFIDELENSKNSAAASALRAAQSEEAAKGWKNDIEDYKTGLELFYARATDGITNSYNTSISGLSAAKNSAISDLTLQKNSIQTNLNNSLNSAIVSIRTNGQSFVNQAQYYAEEAQRTVDNRVSTDHLNQSKGLLTGFVSTDEEVFADVQKYAHSTFDRSKFTVTGSPNITDDGIASGFSGSNFVKVIKSLSASTDFEFEFIYNANSGIGAFFSFSGISVYINVNNEFQAYQGDNYSTTFAIDTAHAFKIKVTNDIAYNRYVIRGYSLDGSLLGTINWSYSHNDFTQIVLGGGSWNSNILGSIDLKQFSITADGVEVFSGNKTGIDTIKPDDYTASNPANITADGVLDQSLGYGYITIDDIGIDVNRPFKIEIPFTKIASASDGTYPIGFYENSFADCYMNDGGFLPRLVFDDNGTATTLSTTPSALSAPILNETVTFKIEYDGNQTYTISIIRQNGTISSGTITTALKLNSKKLFLGRAGYGLTTQYMKVDLNNLKSWSDGNLVYQPCLKIPYTESKTGSKIVGSIYRDRVNDMAEQFGYANYYTLDEDNGNFTLPKGEVYGMIEKLRELIIQRTS